MHTNYFYMFASQDKVPPSEDEIIQMFLHYDEVCSISLYSARISGKIQVKDKSFEANYGDVSRYSSCIIYVIYFG